MSRATAETNSDPRLTAARPAVRGQTPVVSKVVVCVCVFARVYVYVYVYVYAYVCVCVRAWV